MRRFRHFRLPSPRVLRSLVGAALAVGLPAAASAEIFMLRSGGRIEGKWLNRDESPRETYVIQPDLGGELTLDQSWVAQVIEPSADEAKYEQLRPTIPDTVEGHWQLAAWCLEHRLLERRRTHLQRIIELEPNHADARLALGYRNVQGRWMTREEEMAARGLILYKGRYRTQQEIDIWQSEQKQNLAEREWQSKIKRWHGQLNSSKSRQAVDSFRAIRDPYAVPALAKLLDEEQRPQVKLLLIETLAQIGSREALLPLVKTSIRDASEEIRLTCLDHLIASKSPDALKYYVAALKDKDNVKVNRAASALRSLNDSEAVGPLIDALVTKHKYKIVTGGGGGGGSGSPGQISSSFSPTGGGGFSFGDKPPQIIEKELRNEQVLGALIDLTSQNFSYDMIAWKRWHAAQKNALQIDARRD